MPLPDVTPASAAGMCGVRIQQLKHVTRAYVDDGRMPNCQVVVARAGRIVYHDSYGFSNVAKQIPLRHNDIYRLYSMTKPITCVAAMICYERNCFQMDDLLERYLPEWRDMQVYIGGDADNPQLEPARAKITIKHLFTHCGGITAAGLNPSPLGTIQARLMGPPRTQPTFSLSGSVREAHDDSLAPAQDLEEYCKRLAKSPLFCHPGDKWHYGACHSVLGRLVEVWSGETLDDFFQKNIFDPLKMTDTGFKIPEASLSRLVENYFAMPDGQDGKLHHVSADSAANSEYILPGGVFNGSGGLLGTLQDYYRFAQMLCNKGELDGSRILSTRSVEYMSLNHLPGNCDLAEMGIKTFTETPMDGIGFGLGMAVCIDPVKSHTLQNVGEFYWGGAASTAFYVDPRESLVCVFLTQVLPSGTYPVRRQLRICINQAIVSDAPPSKGHEGKGVMAKL